MRAKWPAPDRALSHQKAGAVMDTFQANTLRKLAREQHEHCVSVFLPVLRGENVGLENPIRLKNLLRGVEEGLVQRGWRTTAARDFVQAIHAETESAEFWDTAGQGLAVFGSETGLQIYPLPLPVAELWVIGKNFHLTPLLPSETDGEFVVVAVSQNACRVLRGRRWQIEAVSIPEIPTGMAQVLGPIEHEVTREAHGGTRHGSQRATVFTGQGGTADYLKPEIAEYFRAIDRALHRYLGIAGEPLVFAGVHSLLPLYQAVNTYAGLEARSIDGNPELLSDRELHQRAWAIVEPRFRVRQQRILGSYESRRGTELASSDLATVLHAAHHGRVESLLLAPGRYRWGTYDGQTGEFRYGEAHESGVEDLLNLAAVETWRHSGEVFASELEQAGVHEAAAAVFRYAEPALSVPQSNANATNQRF